MKLNNILSSAGVVVLAALATGCSVGSTGGGSSSPPQLQSTVSATQVVSITVAPATASIPTGSAQQYAATGVFGDSSIKDITASVTWSSSSTDIAAVSNSSGLFDAISSATVGTTMIMARSGNVSGSAILTVTGGGAAPEDNVLPITVNGSRCSANSYLNKPCVSITICSHATLTCQTIDDIIVDTGSFGLRVFSSPVLTVPLTPVLSGSGVLAECAQFGDGTSLWGQVETADLILGNELASSVPIQVINASLPGAPALCANAEQSPATAGFNGLLGVGVFNQDCGPGCVGVANANNGMYYSCTGASCIGAEAQLTDQVQNPVASLPTDSNGVIVEFQSVPLGGAPSANGILVLGIGTRANNTPPLGVTTYKTDAAGEIQTIFRGAVYPSIIDSGSNGLFFTPPAAAGVIPSCPSPNSAWFCPSPAIMLSAVNEGALGPPSNDIFFQIGNLNILTGSFNRVYSNIGGSNPGLFDWGLPAYLGRDIYVGINGKSANFGTGPVTGPYFAY